MGKAARRVLAGDVGGTKTLLAVYQAGDDGLRPLFEARLENAGHSGIGAVLGEFLRRAGPAAQGVETVCLGVAGPVSDGAARLTNLDWRIDAAGLATAAGVRSARVINDFEAVGYGLAELGPADLVSLQAGEPRPDGVRALIGAGTGLGEAFLLGAGEEARVMPSEGSHADFAPADEEQVALWRWLAGRHGHVSWERVVSGPGLLELHEFFRQASGQAPSPDLAQRLAAGDAGAVAESALAGADPAATRALDVFLRAWGAEAGNLALKTLAFGGVYVAGGIAPRLLDQLADGRFLRSFLAKGRFAGLLARIPVRVVVNSQVGLLGAGAVAARLL